MFLIEKYEEGTVELARKIKRGGGGEKKKGKVFLSPQAVRGAGINGVGVQEKHQIGRIEANQAGRRRLWMIRDLGKSCFYVLEKGARQQMWPLNGHIFNPPVCHKAARI